MSSWLTATDVARLLGTPTAAVNRLRRQGSLFAGRRRNGRYAYPTWQFDCPNRRPLPGLQAVLAVFAGDHDIVGVSALMTGTWEQLDDLSAAAWLAQWRPIDAVLEALENSEQL